MNALTITEINYFKEKIIPSLFSIIRAKRGPFIISTSCCLKADFVLDEVISLPPGDTLIQFVLPIFTESSRLKFG